MCRKRGPTRSGPVDFGSDEENKADEAMGRNLGSRVESSLSKLVRVRRAPRIQPARRRPYQAQWQVDEAGDWLLNQKDGRALGSLAKTPAVRARTWAVATWCRDLANGLLAT